MRTVFLARRTTALVGRSLVWTRPVRCGFWAGYRLLVYKHVIKAIRRPSELKSQFVYTFCYNFVIFADTMSSYVVCKTNERVWMPTRFEVQRLSAVNYNLLCWERRLYLYLIVLVGGRKFKGPSHIVTGSESSREWKFQGTKVPGSESTTYGTFAPDVGTKVP